MINQISKITWGKIIWINISTIKEKIINLIKEMEEFNWGLMGWGEVLDIGRDRRTIVLVILVVGCD